MQINAMNNMSQVQGAGGPPGGRPPGGGPMKAGMDAAAETLGLSAEDLKSALDEGSTLEELASSAGVSTDDLEAAMAAAIEDVAPAQAAERMTADLGSIISGERPPPPPRSGGGPGQTDVQSAVEKLAEALDTSTEDLFASIEAGTLADLFETAGVSTQVGLFVNTSL